MKFDWTGTSDPLSLQPGTYHVEITASTEATSQNGNPMWNLTLKALDFNSKLCHDRMMLNGGGANITAAKLSALGFEKGSDVEAGHLCGKRLWVTVKTKNFKDKDGNDRTGLEVDISKGKCGYHSEKPEGVTEPNLPF